MITITNRDLGASFFESRLGLHRSEDARFILFIHESDAIPNTLLQMDQVAVAVAYNAFVGHTCCAHIVIQKPQHYTRSVIRETFVYPFEQCGIRTIIGLVDSTNHAALNLDRRLGFKDKLVIPGGGLDGDLVILTLDKADCRWLKRERHGQEVCSESAGLH